MTTILIVLGVAAVLGAIFAKMSGESATGGAAAGAWMAGSCVLQLAIMGVMALAGLYILKLIIG
jgi:hypothetical protein